MQYRLNNGGPLVDTGDRILDEDELADLQEAWDAPDQETYDRVADRYGAKTVVPNDSTSEMVPAQVVITTDEYDRLRRAAGEL